MKNMILFTLMLSIFYGNSQETNVESAQGTITSMDDFFSKKLVGSGQSEVSGNPFLYDEWNNVGTINSKGKTYNYNNLNYNIYKDEVALSKGKDSVFVIDKDLVDSFTINNKNFQKYNNSFYEVLVLGKKVSLLKKYEIKVIEGMFNPTDGKKEIDRLSIVDDYYVNETGNILKFKPSKKALTKLFSDKENEVNNYIKMNKLSYKKEGDIIKIFKFYNEIE